MNKWMWILFVFIGIYIIGSLVALFFVGGDSSEVGDRIVVVPIRGAIGTGVDTSLFSDGSGVSSGAIVKKIEEVKKDDSVKGVIFEIDSPGGTVVASQEIADAIKNINKTNYAVIRESGASGAYWIASATNKIFASPMSITGSIGVYGSYLEFSGLFEKYGVGYERLVGGEYKDLGVPYKNLSEDETKLLQSKLDKIHVFFIREVAKNRNMSVNDVTRLATGEFYLGEEAKDLGLIDEFGNRDVAVKAMRKQLNITDLKVVEKKSEASLLDMILGNLAYQFGRGFATTFIEFGVSNRYEIRA